MTRSCGFVKRTMFPFRVIICGFGGREKKRKKTFQLYIFQSNRKFSPIEIRFVSNLTCVCNHHVRAREGTRIREYDTINVCFVHFVIRAIYLTIVRFSNKSDRQLCGDISLYIFFLIVYPTNGKISRPAIDFERGESIATMMISIAGTIHDGNRARVERDNRS